MKGLPTGIERLPSGRYRGVYRTPQGKRHTPSYPLLREAVAALAAAKTDLAGGQWIDPRSGQITLDRWFAEWSAQRPGVRDYVADKDAARYRNHIAPWLGSAKLTDLDEYAVQRWIVAALAAGRNPPTVRKAFALLRTCLGMRGAMGAKRIRANPCVWVVGSLPTHMPPAWQLLTRTQFDTLLAEIPEQYRALVVTLAYTGLRFSEAAGLLRSAIDLDTHTLTVERGTVEHKGHLIDGATKNSRRRTIPLHPRVIEALSAHIAARPMLPTARVFTSPRGATLKGTHFHERVFTPARRAAGLPRVRIHDLRHSCASWLLNGGMDIHEVAEMLGHSTVTTTMLYAHTDAGEKRAALLAALGE